jgi:AraC-like DNA-binding protein
MLGRMADLQSAWALFSGHRPMLTGRIQTHHCDPHLHDTFTIAYMRRGTAHIQVRSQPWVWRSGQVFLGNPFEVHAGGNADAAIEYDVFYPNIELITECAGLSAAQGTQPRFGTAILDDPRLVAELLEVLGVGSPDAKLAAADSSAGLENGLRRFFRQHPQLLYLTSAEKIAPIRAACQILQRSVDSKVRWADLSRQVGCSRPHFIRLFHKTTGLAPNVYFRQLRLSKALRLICAGVTLAAAALEAGFTDQAHLTREFKRAFGRTPGKVAHDILRTCVAGGDASR